jgi:LPS-assembly lipoprotein
MWSSRAQALRTLALVAALGAPLALAGCTGFTPVYGTNSLTAQQIEIAYAAPSNRLEQLIYQDLRLRLGKASGPAPTLQIQVDGATKTPTSEIVTTPHTPQIVKVTAAIVLTDVDGTVLFSGTRSQIADYETGAQVLAGNQALSDASERAAHLLADTIRLTVLGALSR